MDDSMALGYALGQDTNNNGGGGMWGGDGSWIFAFLIIALIFGGGRWGGLGGFGGGSGGGDAYYGGLTRGDLCSEFNFNGLENSVRGIQQGICDSTYALNTSILNGFHGVDNAVCTLGYQTQQGFSNLAAQMANCCCETQRAIDGVNLHTMQGFNGVTMGLNNLSTQLASCCCDTQRQIERGFSDLNYNLATQECQTRQTIQDTTRDVLDNQNANTRAILDFLTQDKIASLQAENQSLKFAASQAAQNTFITANQEAQTAELIRRLGRDCPVPAYVVPNPNCCYGNPYGYGFGNFGFNRGNDCGCGCGCN